LVSRCRRLSNSGTDKRPYSISRPRRKLPNLRQFTGLLHDVQGREFSDDILETGVREQRRPRCGQRTPLATRAMLCDERHLQCLGVRKPRQSLAAEWPALNIIPARTTRRRYWKRIAPLAWGGNAGRAPRLNLGSRLAGDPIREQATEYPKAGYLDNVGQPSNFRAGLYRNVERRPHSRKPTDIISPPRKLQLGGISLLDRIQGRLSSSPCRRGGRLTGTCIFSEGGI